VAKLPHPGWEHLFLFTGGLPTSDGNINFLGVWSLNTTANANYNPNDLSHHEPGSTNGFKLPNGKHAQNYTDTASAAEAFKAQIDSGDYPDLHKALEGGDPWTYDNPSGVALNLQRWGSPNFQTYYVQNQGVKAVGAGSGNVPGSKNVGAAWTHLMRTLATDGHRTIIELQKATAALSRIERRLRRA
jgi:hypothetical protein